MYQQKRKHKKSFIFPPISQLKLNYEKNVNLLNKTTNENIENEFEILLAQKKLSRLYEKALKKGNLKYQGIYFFKKENFAEAEKLFRKIFAENKADDEVASYLAAIYIKKKSFDYALNILNTSKSNSYVIDYNKAVVYEKAGNLKKAVLFYKKSLQNMEDPLLTYRIKVKLFILKLLSEKGL
jgi:tetratricopeptide (TPR) repeat protein